MKKKQKVEIETPASTRNFDAQKCSALYEDLILTFQKHKATVGEILIAYGNLGYALGASIGEFTEKGPSIEELNKLYYAEPGRLDVALMVTGLQVSSWYDEWQKLLEEKVKEKEN